MATHRIMQAWVYVIGPVCAARAVQFYRRCPDGCHPKR